MSRWSQMLIPLVGIVLTSCTSTFYVDLDPMPSATPFHRKQLQDVYVQLKCTRDPFISPSDADTLCEKVGRSLQMLGARTGSSTVGRDPKRRTVSLQIAVKRLGTKRSTLNTVFAYASFYMIPVEEDDIYELHMTAFRRNPPVTISDRSRLAVRKLFSLVYQPINDTLNYLRDEDHQLTPERSHQRYSKNLYLRAWQIVVQAASMAHPVVATGGA